MASSIFPAATALAGTTQRTRDDRGNRHGGGLAGAAFAIELARHGRRVVIPQRTTGPHHKVCGEFLSAEAQSLLAGLGVDVWELGARLLTHLGLEFGNYQARVKLPFRAAGLSRYRLDQALLDAAVRAGVEVRRGETVTNLEHGGATATVHTAGRAMPADHVALATGKHNLRGVQRPQTANIAFKMQVRPDAAAAATLDELVHLSMFRGGYAGVCLVEDGIATICWVIERDALGDTAVSWDAHAEFLSRRSAFFAKIIDGAQALWDKPVAVASIPYGFLRGGYHRRRHLSDRRSACGDSMLADRLMHIACALYRHQGGASGTPLEFSKPVPGRGDRQAAAADRLGKACQCRLRQYRRAARDGCHRAAGALGAAAGFDLHHQPDPYPRLDPRTRHGLRQATT